jgi:hypothetical protein
MFNADGTMAFPAGPLTIWSPEFFGDTAVVNGKVWPNLNVARGVYRFRVVNASNARVYNLYLSLRFRSRIFCLHPVSALMFFWTSPTSRRAQRSN